MSNRLTISDYYDYKLLRVTCILIIYLLPPKSGKKGLTLEEKRTKLLQFFIKDHLFYTIKEVESLGGKFTGIHPMQIKEVLTSLVDDGLVNSEKCGVSILFWCFEYDKQKKVKEMLSKEEQKLGNLNKQFNELQEKIKFEESVRKIDDAEFKMNEISRLTNIKKELTNKFESSGFNMEKVDEVQKNLQNEIEIGEICTDNIESMLYHFKNSNGIDRKVFNQELGIPEEFKDFPNLNEFFAKLK
ncbi:Meiotic nuclear division protein 1 [Wickerhamomyces ciferrii]|uniref:Meiotic nuclear division protein 1 n=1 Tax=Wickerhamomyces ciferrii (strain ATCC 14091 / BCRC 22168 / CBS 111 / JCM 3599 / NBRC 0793 / NRRL Y-1031 F-60-10) TaxID=1206466 RepID=K0KT34_WICCF|nr:Meiotic nuclear division protein 1 [Wickerhamomyces ciferrii]CCH44534.1 Meiotic nuclear division protein 1 [Wickerhamomyces ciferrii]